MGFLFSKMKAFKLQPSALLVFQIPEIPETTSNVKFHFSEADPNKLFTEGLQVYPKRSPTWMFCWEVSK